MIEDEADPESENDFGKNVIPSLLRDGRDMYAYHFSGYWKDVGTISSLWEANMEVLDPEHSGIDLFEDDWKIYSRNSGKTGHRILDTGVVENSMVTDAVVMGGTVIKKGASVKHCIVAENVVIGENAVVGEMPKDGTGSVATIGSGVYIGDGAKVGPAAMIDQNVKDGEEQW